jgi:hypothetical protein
VRAGVRVLGGRVGLPDLGDDGVVRVADVGDRALAGLGDQLVPVQRVEAALVGDPGDQVVLGDADGVREWASVERALIRWSPEDGIEVGRGVDEGFDRVFFEKRIS